MWRLRDLKRMGRGRAVRRRLGSGWRRRPAVGLAAMGVVIMLSMWTDDIYVDIWATPMVHPSAARPMT